MAFDPSSAVLDEFDPTSAALDEDTGIVSRAVSAIKEHLTQERETQPSTADMINAPYYESLDREAEREKEISRLQKLNPSASREDLMALAKSREGAQSAAGGTREDRVSRYIAESPDRRMARGDAEDAANFDISLEQKVNEKFSGEAINPAEDGRKIGVGYDPTQDRRRTQQEAKELDIARVRAEGRDFRETNPKTSEMLAGFVNSGAGIAGFVDAVAENTMFGKLASMEGKVLFPSLAKIIGPEKLSRYLKRESDRFATDRMRENFIDSDDKLGWMTAQFLSNAPSLMMSLAGMVSKTAQPIVLGVMGAMSGGGQYRELVDDGVDNGLAALAMMGYGAAEILSEAMPMKMGQEFIGAFRRLPKEAQASLAVRAMKGAGLTGILAGTESIEEIAAEGGQIGIDIATGAAQKALYGRSPATDKLDQSTTAAAAVNRAINSAAGGFAGGMGHGAVIGGAMTSGMLNAEPPANQPAPPPADPTDVSGITSAPDTNTALREAAKALDIAFTQQAPITAQAGPSFGLMDAGRDRISSAISASEREAEFSDLLKREQADLAYLRRAALGEAQKERDWTPAIEQARDEAIERANALTRVSGFDDQQPTAMQIALQRARERKQNASVQPASGNAQGASQGAQAESPVLPGSGRMDEQLPDAGAPDVSDNAPGASSDDVAALAVPAEGGEAVAPKEESAYLKRADLDRAFSDQYMGADSRTTPSIVRNPPVGSWILDDRNGLHGREIEQVVEIPVDNIEVSEDTGPARWADVKRYAEWAKEGKEIPVIHVLQTDAGTLKTIDHRRLMAAKAAGLKTILARVSWSGMDGNVATGLTYEMAQRGIQPLPIKTARSDRLMFPDDAKAIERIRHEITKAPAQNKSGNQPAAPVAESLTPAIEAGDAGVAPSQDKDIPPPLTKEAAHRQARQFNDDTVAAPHPTIPGMWALMSKEEADAQKPTQNAAQAAKPEEAPKAFTVAESGSPLVTGHDKGFLKQVGQKLKVTPVFHKNGDAYFPKNTNQEKLADYLLNGIVPNAQRSAQAKARMGAAPDPAKDSLFTAIAKLGGINTEDARSEWGLDPTTKLPSGVFRKQVLTPGGLSVDDMREMLVQYGYLDESGTIADLEAAFDKEMRGEKQYSHIGHEANLEAEEEARKTEAEKEYKQKVNKEAIALGLKQVAGGRTLEQVEADIDREVAERATWGKQAQKAAQLTEDLAYEDESAFAEEVNLKIQEIQDELRSEQIERAAEDARLSAEEYAQENPEERDQDGASAEGAGFALEGQSSDEIAAEEVRLKAAEAQRQAEERKDQADKERGSFALTGSNRPTDVLAAHGQQDLLAKPVSEVSTPDLLRTVANRLEAENVSPASTADGKPRFGGGTDEVSTAEQELRDMAHAEEQPGDVLLASNSGDAMLFVPFEAAVRLAREGIESGAFRPVPAQLHFNLNLAMRDVNRVLAAATRAAEGGNQGGKQEVATQGQEPDIAEQERKVYTVNEPDPIAGDLFPEELQRETLSKTERRASAGKPETADRNLRSAAALSVRQAPETPGLYHTTTQLVTVGERSLPVPRVLTIEDAAKVFAYLPQFAVEHYDALVTDKSGKPLAFIGSFKGAATQAAVYPQTIMMELARIDGAAHLWTAHNHPGGVTDLSRADENLSKTFADILRGTSVEYHGLFAFTARPGEGIAYRHEGGKVGTVSRDLPAPHRVPIVERIFDDASSFGDKVSSPKSAFSIVQQIAKETPGVVFLSAQNDVLAFVPLEPEEMGALRSGDRLMRLFNAASRAGGAAAIVAMPNGRVTENQFANIKGALSAIDVKTLDGIRYDTATGQAESLSEKGKDFTNGTQFYSHADSQAPISNPHTADTLRTALGKAIGSDKFIPALEKMGKVRFVSGKEAIPKGAVVSQYAAGRPLAFFNPEDGITYFIYDNIPATATKGKLYGLLSHEIGVHALHLGRNDKEFRQILKDLEFRREAGNKEAIEAFRRAENAEASEADMTEEALGYLVESAPHSTLAKRFLAWFKTWVNKVLGLARMHWKYTEADMAAMAQSALRRAPELFDESETQADNAIQTETGVVYASKLERSINEFWKNYFDTGTGRLLENVLRDGLPGQRNSERHNLFARIRAYGGEDRGSARTGSALTDGPLGLESVYWTNALAGIPNYITTAETRGDVFVFYAIPAELVEYGKDLPAANFDDTAIVRITLAKTDNGKYELGITAADKGTSAYALLEKAGRITDTGQVDSRGAGYNRAILDSPIAETTELLAEAIRRLSLHEGQIPTITYSRDTGANPRTTPYTISPDRIISKFSAQAPTFYSALIEAAEQIPSKLKTGNEIALWLQANIAKLQVKKEELQWTGVTDWLQMRGKEKTSKEDVAEFLKGNGVKVEEVALGGFKNEWEVLDPDTGLRIGETYSTEEAANASAGERGIVTARPADDTQGGAKFEGYVPPGGKPGTYRELLLTLPEKKPSPYDRKLRGRMEYKQDDAGKWNIWDRDDWVFKSGFDTLDAVKEFASEDEQLTHTPDTNNFRSSHFDQPNILAHLRVDEVEGANGGRLLRVIELQSDWGAKGRKEGFANPAAKAEIAELAKQYDALNSERNKELTAGRDTKDEGAIFAAHVDRAAAIAKQLDALQERMDTLRSQSKSSIPSAPFVTDTGAWLSLAIKKAISHAANNGFDGIVFATGQQNADLYDLSNQITQVNYAHVGGDVFLMAVGNDGRVVFDKVVKPSELEDIVGKDVAKKITDDTGAVNRAALWPEWSGPHKTLSGLDLKVGGEGMRAFYDKIVPDTANKVLRQIGAAAKVGEIGVDMGAGVGVKKWTVQYEDGTTHNSVWTDRRIAEQIARAEYGDRVVPYGETGQRQPGFLITDAIREKVSRKGLPLFSKSQDIVQDLNEELASNHGEEWRNAYVLDNARSTRQESLAAAFRTVFGVDIIPIKPTEQQFNTFAGMRYDGRIYVNTESSHGFVQLAGHELLHQLKRDRPELYAYLANQARMFIVSEGTEQFRERLNAALMPHEEQYTSDGAEEELLGDFVGDALADQRFLQQMADADPSLFTRLLNAVKDWLADVSEKLVKAGFGSSQYVRDVDGLRNHIAGVLAAYAEIKQAPANSQQSQGGIDYAREKSDGQLPPNQWGGVSAPMSIPQRWGAVSTNAPIHGLEVQRTFGQVLHDITATSKSFSWLRRHFGTQYGKALKDPDNFGRVFNRVDDYVLDTTLIATGGHELMPHIVPMEEKLRDIVKPFASRKDQEAAADALYYGTFLGGPSPKDGRVFTDEELRTARIAKGDKQFPVGLKLDFAPLNKKQIQVYREARAAIDYAVAELHKAGIWKIARKTGITREDFDGVPLEDAAAMAVEKLEEARDDALMSENQAGADMYAQKIRDVQELAEEAQALIGHGYMPAMRFGDFAVTVKVPDGDGKRVTDAFMTFPLERQANLMKRLLEVSYKGKGAKVTVSMLPKESHLMFEGVSVDAMSLLAKHISIPEVDSTGNVTTETLEEDPVMQAWLDNALPQRSGLKHQIHRKGIAGFSRDLERILTKFLTGYARMASSTYHMTQAVEAWDNIPKEKADSKDEAAKLIDHIRDPKEKAALVKGLMFFQLLGGDPTRFLINITQPVQTGMPWLVANGASTAEASKYLFGPEPKTQEYKDAFRKAREEGLTAPQELHQLMGVSRGSLVLESLPESVRASLPKWMQHMPHKVNLVWAVFQQISEQINRERMFKAAWKLWEKNGKQGDPMAFARKAINETQFVYGKHAVPNVARTTMGSIVMTYTQFPIMFIEMALRLPPKAAMLLLFILWAFAGAEGEPFAENLEDMVDAIGQWSGHATHSRQWLRDFIKENGMGAGLEASASATLAEIILRGPVSALSGVDVGGRFSLGKLIPFTKALVPSEQDKGRELFRTIGPLGSIIDNATKATGDMFAGEMGKAIRRMAPRAAQNAVQGYQMLDTGEYRTMNDNLIAKDVTTSESVGKMIGLHPERIGMKSRAVQRSDERAELVKTVQHQILNQWARAAEEGDDEGVRKAKARRDEWNAKNPEDEVRISYRSLVEAKRRLRRDADQRAIRRAPKQLRNEIREDLR